MMTRKWGWLVGLGASVLWGSYSQAVEAPKVLSKSAVELVGAAGRLSSIAVDTLDQPHLVCDGGTMAYFYDRIGGTWRASSLDMTTVGFRQYYNPRLEIDGLDRAWVSGILVDGFGTIVRENLRSNPSAPYFSNQRVGGVWDSGNLSIDPVFPNEAVLMSAYGQWKKVVYSASSPSRVVAGASGTMFAGRDGEKKGFWIDKYHGAKAHADGTSHSVWHLAVSGYSEEWPNQYQNSLRSAQGLSQVTWVAFKPGLTDTMGDDGTYPDCVSDAKNPLVAYMTCDFSIGYRFDGTDGVVMNIWDGSKMVFDPQNALTIDREGSSGMRRYAPQLAAAKDGGVFIAWTHGNTVRLAYYTEKGEKGWEETVGAGSLPDIGTDSKGNLHIVWNSNGIRYQKWTISGSVAAASLPGDFNGDGQDDLALFNAASAQWSIQSMADSNLLVNARSFGFAGGTPLIGDFDGDARSDIAVYDSLSNRWVAQSVMTTSTLFSVTFGAAGAVPVVGDFDNNGRDEIGTWNPTSGVWTIENPLTQIPLLANVWGGVGAIPAVADYDGDGRADLGLYNPGESKWYIRSSANLSGQLVSGRTLGLPGSIPVPGDYDGDGSAELATVNASTYFWLSQPLNQPDGPIVARQWGFQGTRPVIGDFNGDGSLDIGVWNSTDGLWYLRASDSRATYSWARQWGFNGATLVAADYNNDRKTDLGVYGNGDWYICESDTNHILAWANRWGGFSGATPCVGDYDGDGAADQGVYDRLSGKWYIKTLAGNVLAWGRQWGYANIRPIAGDFNGDHIADLAVYDPNRGRWFIQSLAGSVLAWDVGWGFNGTRAYAGDFDGDLKDDLAVFYPASGQWFVRSLDGALLAWALNWGYSGAEPVIGDFDGDGADDVGIFGNGSWYIYSLKNHSKSADKSAPDPVLAWNRTWSVAGAIPVAGDFDGDKQNDLIVFDPATGYWYAQSLRDRFTILAWGRPFGSAGMTPMGSPAF